MLVNKLSTSVPLTHTCTARLHAYIVLPPEVLSAEIKIAQSMQTETDTHRKRGKAKETEQNKKWCPPAADACQLGNARWKQSHMVAVFGGSCPGCQYWFLLMSCFGKPCFLSPRLKNLLLPFPSQPVAPNAEDRIKSEPVSSDKVSLTWHARERWRREMLCSIHTSSYFCTLFPARIKSL